MAERWDPADGEAGGRVGLGGAGAAQARPAADRRQPGDIHAVGATDEGDDGLQLAALASRVHGRHEDEALDDLAQLHADGSGRFLGGVRGLTERDDLDVDTALAGRVDHALVGWMHRVWHGTRSL